MPVFSKLCLICARCGIYTEANGPCKPAYKTHYLFAVLCESWASHLIKTGKLCSIDNCVSCHIWSYAAPETRQAFFSTSDSQSQTYKDRKPSTISADRNTLNGCTLQSWVLTEKMSHTQGDRVIVPCNDAVSSECVWILFGRSLWQLAFRLHAHLHLTNA